jgi:protein TonB
MLPIEKKARVPAQERWFWLGVGFVSALGVLVLGLVLATYVTAHEASKHVAALQPAAPAPLSRKPAASHPAMHRRKAPARVAHRKPVRPIVRVVERPLPAEQRSATAAPASSPARLPVPRAGGAPGSAQPGIPGVARVAGSRQEWGNAPALRGWQGSGPRAEQGTATPPRLLQSHGAEYPTSAMDEGVTGKAQLQLNVGPDGFVDGVVVTRSSGDARLDAAAARAAMTWRYRPARRNGLPVSSADHVQFEFFRRGG